ncbi:MAG: N-formylglutamate amidohydrolase [Pseudomonadota bacterium]|nr:N-formylglutamate amidohydrolase [Pseudomonadota bacterium]
MPPQYRSLFAGQRDVLRTHRGWDPGALTLAEELAAALGAPIFASTTTRLLIDLNRSIGTPRLYSEYTRPLPLAARRRVVAEHYRPHREPIEAWVGAVLAAGQPVVHIASHSFTPELDGQVRNADVGLLYDPKRPAEVALSNRWLAALGSLRPDLRLRRNYPYLGDSDGLTYRFRRTFPAEAYLGIELEVNQQFVLRGGAPWPKLRAALTESLQAALVDSAFGLASPRTR